MTVSGPTRGRRGARASHATVAERVRDASSSFTPSERKVARTLLADYPLVALEPVATLAGQAGVSGPTVLRFAAKLGFGSYAALQRALKAEVSARLSSPLEMLPTNGQRTGERSRVVERAGRVLSEAVRSTFATLPAAELEAALDLLADERRRIVTVGGRFSSMLASYLANQLRLLRADVSDVPAAASDRMAMLLDVDRRHVVVAFDYRRYQRDTVQFGAVAKEQGAAVLLFTDRYLSPLAAHADVVLPSVVKGPSPFDALTPALAVVEAIVAGLVDRLGSAPRGRMARYDALNDKVTIDGGLDVDLTRWDPQP